MNAISKNELSEFLNMEDREELGNQLPDEVANEENTSASNELKSSSEELAHEYIDTYLEGDYDYDCDCSGDY